MSTLSFVMVVLMRTTSLVWISCILRRDHKHIIININVNTNINITINKQIKNNVIARYCGISYILRLR